MRGPLSNFKLSVQKVRAIVSEINSQATEALKDSAVLMRHETTQCAVTVVLSGFFESFLKETAEAFIEDVCARAIPFEDLPSRIKRTHFEDGGAWLTKQARLEAKDGTSLPESHDISRRLASVASSPYELLWEAFANTKSNPGPTTVKEFLNSFGVQDAWKKVASKAGFTDTTLSTLLDSFIHVRNECAHTGTAKSIPVPSAIEGYCDVLEKISNAVVEVLEEYLQEPCFSPKT